MLYRNAMSQSSHLNGGKCFFICLFRRCHFENISKHSSHCKTVALLVATMSVAAELASVSWGSELLCKVLLCREWSSLCGSKSNCAVNELSSSCSLSTWLAGASWLDHGSDDRPWPYSDRGPSFLFSNQAGTTNSKAGVDKVVLCLFLLFGLLSDPEAPKKSWLEIENASVKEVQIIYAN